MDEAKEEEDPKKPQATWKFKTRFPIQDRMEEIIHLTVAVADKELVRLRRKMERMRLGS